MTTLSPKRDLHSLLFKTGLALLIPFLLFTFLGCVPEVDEQLDYGPEAQVSEVDAALQDALGQVDFTQIREGEYAERFHIAEVQGRYSVPKETNSLEVLTRTEDETKLAYKLVYTTLLFKDGTAQKPTSREFPLSFCKPGHCDSDAAQSSGEITERLEPVVLRSMDMAELTPQFQKLWAQAHLRPASEAPTIDRFTLHNLKVLRGQMTPPAQVKDSADCRGLNPCELNVIQVSYDQVMWYTDGKSEALQIVLRSSTQLPFFSRYKFSIGGDGSARLENRPLSYCVTYAVSTSKINDCEDLVDFIPGNP